MGNFRIPLTVLGLLSSAYFPKILHIKLAAIIKSFSLHKPGLWNVYMLALC